MKLLWEEFFLFLNVLYDNELIWFQNIKWQGEIAILPLNFHLHLRNFPHKYIFILNLIPW